MAKGKEGKRERRREREREKLRKDSFRKSLFQRGKKQWGERLSESLSRRGGSKVTIGKQGFIPAVKTFIFSFETDYIEFISDATDVHMEGMQLLYKKSQKKIDLS